MRTATWRTSVIIASVVGLAKADASAVGVVAPALRSDLHITTAQLGLVGVARQPARRHCVPCRRAAWSTGATGWWWRSWL